MLSTLVLLFEAYALGDGLIAILYGISGIRTSRVWVLLLEGALGVLVGVITFLWPHTTAYLPLYVITSWAIVTGVLEIAAMAWLRRVGLSGLLLAISGVLSVALRVALFFMHESGMVALTWVVASYALVFGALLIWLGLHLRRLYQALVSRALTAAAKRLKPPHLRSHPLLK